MDTPPGWSTTWFYNNGYSEIVTSGFTLPNYFIWQAVGSGGTDTVNFDGGATLYNSIYTATFTNNLNAPITLGTRFDNGFAAQTMSDIMYWVRSRTMPPNDILPSTSYGSLSSSLAYTFQVNSVTNSNAFQYNIVVTDSEATPATANSVPNTITVNQVLTTPSIFASNMPVNAGGTETFTANQFTEERHHSPTTSR